MQKLASLLILSFLFATTSVAQDTSGKTMVLRSESQSQAKASTATLFGVASFYADKFNGRKTASGAIYTHNALTAACNILPLGTWVRITNMKNKKSVVVQINDRLHPRMTRIVDLSKMAAEKLGYVRSGLTRVKVEVLKMK